MATARGPRGAPDSGARITKDRVQLPGQGPAWPLARIAHAGFVRCRAVRACAAPGAGPRDAACGVCQQPGGGGCITSRLIIRLRESRTHEHDVLGHRTEPVRTDTEPPAAGNRGLLVSPLVASCNRGQSNVSSHTSYDYVQIYALSSRATTHPHLPRLGPSALPWRCVAMRAPPRVAA